MSSSDPKHVAVSESAHIADADDLLPDLEKEEPERTRIADRLSLKAAAGTAALLLGGIYAFGAIIKAGQLHGADQAVGDTLTLVPLEQILVLGIKELLPIGAVIAGGLLIGMAFLDDGQPWQGHSRDPDEELSEATRRRIRIGARIFTGFIWVWMFFDGSWTFWMFVVFSTATAWYAATEHSTARSYSIFLATAVLLLFAGNAYFNPSPLPDATLTKRDGTVVAGDLIATTGSTWYIGMRDKKWTAVQAREVDDVEVTTAKRDQNESLYPAITGDRLFGLGPE